MGYTIAYRTAKPVGVEKREAIFRHAEELAAARSWCSCEPLVLMPEPDGDHLFGCSKPSFFLDPEEVAEAEEEGLPDGTIDDLVESLRLISAEHQVDWLFSDDYEESVGSIIDGECDAQLQQKLREVRSLIDSMRDSTGEGGLSLFSGFDD